MKLKSYLPEIAVIGLGLVLRLIHYQGSFWLDEAAQALESIRPLSEQLNISNDFQPPLYHLIVHGLIQISQSEAWLRLASLIPGLLTIWLVMAIGKRLFSRNVGLTAGVLLATSQFHLFYSQELRPYSLATCLALISFWGWLDLVKSKRRISPILLLSSLAGLYSMYLFPVFLLSLLILTIIFYRTQTLMIIAHFLLAGLFFLPWLPSFIEQIQIGTNLAQAQPVWSTIVSPPLFKMLPLVFVKFLLGRIAIDLQPTWILITLVLVGISGLLVLQSLKRLNGKLVILTTLLPIGIAWLISIFIPVLDPKRVMFCLPFVYLGLASGLTRNRRSAIVLVVLIVINLSSVANYATQVDNQREPWRQAIHQLESQASDDSIVIFRFDAPFAPWVWYQRRNLETLAITDPKTLPQLSTNSVILFDYLQPLYDPNNQSPLMLQAQGFSLREFHQYPGIGKINLYAR